MVAQNLRLWGTSESYVHHTKKILKGITDEENA